MTPSNPVQCEDHSGSQFISPPTVYPLHCFSSIINHPPNVIRRASPYSKLSESDRREVEAHWKEMALSLTDEAGICLEGAECLSIFDPLASLIANPRSQSHLKTSPLFSSAVGSPYAMIHTNPLPELSHSDFSLRSLYQRRPSLKVGRTSRSPRSVSASDPSNTSRSTTGAVENVNLSSSPLTERGVGLWRSSAMRKKPLLPPLSTMFGFEDGFRSRRQPKSKFSLGGSFTSELSLTVTVSDYQ
ncbi:hypothetical protein M231_07778 [Tremella mesenterica]|uniref:Uncharacterized protein n=1 Tax=Tremella mesenterica TaxID=5217 RepID=A0A4Q1BBD5_TREME|nr:hypothetical protein M231_07778 [Tremella mesenterica]